MSASSDDTPSWVPEWLTWRMQYPTHTIECVRRWWPVHFTRLVRNFSYGAVVDSDFSGSGGAHCAFHYATVALAGELATVPTSTVPRFVHNRACELEPSCRTVLMGRSDAAPIEHVFVDLNDRLPSDVRSLLDSLEPGDDATDDERLGAYSSMQQILKVNARRCFHPDAVVPCARCNQHDCPVFPQSLTADRYWASPSTEPRAKRRRAAGHSEKPWWFNFGSNECVGVSSMGHRRQSADASMRSFSIWSTERVEVGEDVVFQEWTHLGDTAVLDCAFSPRFRRITVETNPRKRKRGAQSQAFLLRSGERRIRDMGRRRNRR